MSPASYLAAPPRVAAQIVAPVPRSASGRCATVSPVDWTIYGALIVGFLAIAAAIARLVARTRDAWQAYKRLRSRLATEFERLDELAESASRAAERAGDQTRLNESLARLQVTLA